jgi:hypothetical protein
MNPHLDAFNNLHLVFNASPLQTARERRNQYSFTRKDPTNLCACL